MIMKKLFAALLVTVLAVSSLTACSDKPAKGSSSSLPDTMESSQNAPDSKTDTENTGDADVHPDAGDDGSDASAGGIRENGSLPEYPEDLTDEEREYYFGHIFDAVVALDTETLADYALDSDDLKTLDAIRNDAQALDFWNKITGSMKYFADSDLLLIKSAEYIYSRWYTECWKNNAELPASTEELSYEETMAIYDKYFAEAPYTCGQLKDLMEIQDGYIKCDLGNIFDNAYGPKLRHVMGMNGMYYGSLLMTKNATINLGHDYIKEAFPEYEAYMSLNLDKLVDITSASISEEDKAGTTYRDYFEKYIIPEDSRAVLQRYVDENFTCLRTESDLKVFYPADAEKDYPYYRGTSEAKEALKNYNIVNIIRIYEYPQDFGHSISPFFYAIIRLEESGEL